MQRNDSTQKVRYDFYRVLQFCIFCCIVAAPFYIGFILYFLEVVDYRVMLVALLSVIFSYLCLCYTYKFDPEFQIYINDLGIKWGNSNLILWSDLKKFEHIRSKKEDYFKVGESTEKLYLLQINRYNEKSIIPLLLKYCPEDHFIRATCHSYIKRRKLHL